MKKRLIVFISGNGGNLQALINAVQNQTLDAEIGLVVSNRRAAYGLTRAENAGIPTLYFPLKPYTDSGKSRRDYDADLAAEVNRYDADLIVLAGWMHIFDPVFFERIDSRVINLHPALPGMFPGAHGISDQFEAFQRGEITHGGCMVHDAIPELDAGPVVGQVDVPIYPDDTLDSFSDRLHIAEHRLLVECVAMVLSDSSTQRRKGAKGETFDFSTFPVLTTERLILRQIRRDDAPTMQSIFSSPEVLRFLNMPPMQTLEKAVEFIGWLADNYAKHEAVDWAITLRESGEMVGMCGAYQWDRENRHIDIGYHLLPAHWGHGYATEASKAIIEWCFDSLNVHRIQADCTDGNIASERVMLKCGFTYEGTMREVYWEHGRFIDNKQFGLLRREFQHP